MKKRSFLVLTALFIICAFILVGCNDTPAVSDGTDTAQTDVQPVDRKYKSLAIRDYEPCHEIKTSTFLDTTTVEGNTYQFSAETTNEEREKFIYAEEDLLAILFEKRALEAEGYTFRVFDVYYTRSDSDESTAYFGLDALCTWKQALATVQAIYGDSTTYGYMYAMANDLASTLGWTTDEAAETADAKIFTEYPELLTLTYPCFIDRYNPEDRINAAKSLSIDIFSKIKKPYSGDADFITEAKAYATANGIEYPKVSFRFTPGSEYSIMGIETDYIDIIMDSTYEFDFYFSGSGYQYDGWENDISTVYKKLDYIVNRLKTIKKQLGGEPFDRVTIQLSHGGDVLSSEDFFEYTYYFHNDIYYLALTHSINAIPEIYARYSTESVADEDCYNGWYYPILYYYLAHEEISAVYRDAMTAEEKAYAEYLTGCSIDTPEGMMKYYEALITSYSEDVRPRDWVSDTSPYWEAVCYADYIIRKFGEKNFIGLMLHPSRNMEYIGMQTYKLLLEWEEYILDDCKKLYPATVDPYLQYRPTTTEKLWEGTAKENSNGGNTYRFDPVFSADDRVSIINTNNILLAYIEKVTGEKPTGLTVNVTAESDARSHSDSALVFIGKEDAGTWKHIFATLGAIYGDYTTYGYLYALSDHIAAELGWERDTAESVATFDFGNNPMLLSLTAPCFNPLYSSAEEIATAKSLSLSLLKKMNSPYAGEGEFLKQIAAYASGIGADYTHTSLRFAYNGATCPVKILANNAEFFISSSYTSDLYYTAGIVRDNWLRNITSMVKYIEEKDSEFSEANKFFGYEPVFTLPIWLKSEVTIKYPDGYVEYLDGKYSSYYTYVEACAISSLLREYINNIGTMISQYSPEADWARAAMAYYYTLEDCYEEFMTLSTDDEIMYYAYAMGTKIDSVEKFINIMDIGVYSWYPEYMPEDQLYSTSGYAMNILSIASFIARNYGEDNFYKVMLDPYSAESVLGKPISAVISEWSDYILTELPATYPKLNEN